jgi:hypothetical protein
VIEQKYLETLERLKREAVEPEGLPPLPGWFARRQRKVPPAAEVLERVPSGPVLI